MSATTPQGSTTYYRCADCAERLPGGSAKCPRCGSERRTMVPAELSEEQLAGYQASRGSRPIGAKLPPLTFNDPTPRAMGNEVVVTSVRLTWGDAFNVVGKFAFVFFVINALAGLTLYLVARVLT